MASEPTGTTDDRWVLRFDRFDRTLHVALMTSFLGLALTGVPLLFSVEPWAARLAGLFGGFAGAAGLHRFFAFVMIATFLAHLGRILRRLVVRREYHLLWGPRSMVPQPRDLFEMIGHMKWFVGLGPRPRFDHFTYWEKFDYWAVFWGMGVIGGSGLLLWIPEFFSRWIPGGVFNIALIVHGEEALLAVVFIFTIHFFNGHLRPEKFPMDTVIFTGKIPLDEIRDERPGEWERLGGEAGLAGEISSAPNRRSLRRGRIGGTIAVTIGVAMAILIISALLRHH